MNWLRALGLVVVVSFLVPFVGSWLGLAPYQELAPAPGFGVEVPAGRLNVHQRGTGRDVVLVHGHPGSAAMMTPLADALVAEGLRVTWYDRMGWGHSSQRPADEAANPTAHARDLLALLAALDLEDPVVVGYSYGGGVAMEADRLEPDAIRTLVLVSSTGPLHEHVQASFLARVITHPLMMRWAFGIESIARAAVGPSMDALATPETLDPEMRDTFLATLALPGVPTNWARERNERYQGFTANRPAEVTACTRVLHGSDDAIVSIEVARGLANEIPGARFTEVRDAGHGLVMARAPWLAEQIADHATSCEPDTAPAVAEHATPGSMNPVGASQ